MKIKYLFVYGTLRQDISGGASIILENDAVFVSRGTVQGKLYDLGRYPGLVYSDNHSDRVTGEIYNIINPQNLLPRLDKYEGCSPDFPEPREYQRKTVQVLLEAGEKAQAWTYFYNYNTSGNTRIKEGDYVEYLRNQKSQ